MNIKKLIFIVVILAGFLILVGDLLLPGIFNEYFWIDVFFSWDCDYNDTFMGVFCNMFFVIKIIAIAFLAGILIYYLKKEV